MSDTTAGAGRTDDHVAPTARSAYVSEGPDVPVEVVAFRDEATYQRALANGDIRLVGQTRPTLLPTPGKLSVADAARQLIAELRAERPHLPHGV